MKSQTTIYRLRVFPNERFEPYARGTTGEEAGRGDRLDKSMAPVWEGQTLMARTLVTLSAGALVLTVSVVQLMADRVLEPAWSWMLPTAWIFFGVSIVTGVVRHGWASNAQSARARFEFGRGKLRVAMQALAPDDKWADEAEALVDKAIIDAWKEPHKAIKVHDWLMTVTGYSFILGMAFLLTFAIRNLPF